MTPSTPTPTPMPMPTPASTSPRPRPPMGWRQKFALIKLAVIVIGLSIIVPMQMMSTNLIVFGDKSHVVIVKGKYSDEYTYVSNRSGRQCAILEKTRTDVYGYASPTQYFNTNLLRFAYYSTLQAAQSAIERFCPTR